MIRYKDTILEDFFIDPITAVITNSKGEVQKIKIRDGRPYFKRHWIHQWQVHTHLGYKKDYDIHHIDENKMNNSLSNLVYLTHSEHAKIHNKIGKKLSDETKRKLSYSHKGKKLSDETKKKMSASRKNHPMYKNKDRNDKISNSKKGHKVSEETKRKISEAKKGKTSPNKGKHYKWITNGIENKRIDKNIPIPDGFRRGRIIRK